ncbi:D-tyrosyl-tRNA(Tyr) deacylase [Amphibacillus sp. MSJ-3]|uniref:D-aminoacyl-tRNA deacylase n=1 Tax=Amphibacillus sp. MSJ-3 TaxID=2841505 RepID=UPI001C0EEDA6|nr:D-aminoacyl-tRNA deacylase [Amphibacillus sp. MSJ-3]MBU5593565.1 D-tyrosyl-tRNA(Tyr) deacylase [Amphibacillus sp. MSJ-3]
MRAIIQRVSKASVSVSNQTIGQINQGLVVLLGVTHNDSEEDADYLAKKICQLRIFEDDKGKMNLSLLDIGGAILSISQFTLYSDTRKGRRPNFMNAAKPDQANELYQYFNTQLHSFDVKVETGEFGALMDVSLVNNGPVTIILDSDQRK